MIQVKSLPIGPVMHVGTVKFPNNFDLIDIVLQFQF